MAEENLEAVVEETPAVEDVAVEAVEETPAVIEEPVVETKTTTRKKTTPVVEEEPAPVITIEEQEANARAAAGIKPPVATETPRTSAVIAFSNRTK